ncbi:HK97-gp10 family putative phage morphogenesis protein [Paenibacillus filicis]|uniref:HK97-gp10 family putative phage morphogenesis protein n=1 Tax=Paenibacillus filicis TaxID=669464 RepID=A0ABU9DXQ6_9BACL
MARRRRTTSNTRLKIEGADKVLDALRDTQSGIHKEMRDLISKAAEIVFREADARAPIGPTGKTRFSLRITTGISKKGNFFASVVVGAHQGESTATSAFYVTFYEYGTSRQPPRPFMRPSYDKKRAEIRRLIKDGLEKAIRDLGV